MDKQILQNLRYKLQKRISRLNSSDEHGLFILTLRQFLNFLNSEVIFVGLINELYIKIPDLNETIDRIVNKSERLGGDTDDEAAAIGIKVLKEIDNNEGTFTNLGYLLTHSGEIAQWIEAIRHTYLIPFYEYIDEHLDDERAVLALLLKYKKRSEWFYKKKLLSLENEGKPKERDLVMDLYSYLFDNGIDFYIEPSSISGEIDIISEQKSEDPLLLDAKIFDGGGLGKSYIIKAFQQIYTYTQQYNKSIGYLLIYKNTDKDLHLNIKTDSLIPYIQYNNKTIFFVIVDIYEHKIPVSQRKPVKAIEINESDFIKIIESNE